MAGSLEFISKHRVTPNTSILDVDNIFTDGYENYVLVMNNWSTYGSTQTSIYLRMINTSGTAISSNYKRTQQRLYAHGSSTLSVDASATFINLAPCDRDDETVSGVGRLYSPKSSTRPTLFIGEFRAEWNGGFQGYKSKGAHAVHEEARGFRLYEPNTRPFASGSVSVYGEK